jgi:hypothetical protein
MGRGDGNVAHGSRVVAVHAMLVLYVARRASEKESC